MHFELEWCLSKLKLGFRRSYRCGTGIHDIHLQNILLAQLSPLSDKSLEGYEGQDSGKAILRESHLSELHYASVIITMSLIVHIVISESFKVGNCTFFNILLQHLNVLVPLVVTVGVVEANGVHQFVHYYSLLQTLCITF